ncbi:MAG TPA: DUF938 domain-containing protein [Nannocystis sp.]
MSLARSSPAALRNRGAIAEVLAEVLQPADLMLRAGRQPLVLEIASGTGEHVVHFAATFPGLVWQPSDRDPEALASIAAHVRQAGLANVRAPVVLDATASVWPVEAAEAIVCINMIHIAPWAACEGLMAGAERILAAGAPLYIYGPMKRDGRHVAESNAAFDADLRARNPAWGVRDVDEVAAAAARHGLALSAVVPMPTNNFSLVFRRS